jgi:D-alanyl-D-alanine-carboxypeptidase/D-alanyl-D-alanine-endopeptidase
VSRNVERVPLHFARTLRRVPAIVVGVLCRNRIEVTALGSVEQEPEPASLCWEIGSITKVFTGLLFAEMSIRGEVALDDHIGRYLPDPVTARLPAPDLQPTLIHLATHTAGLPRVPWAILRQVKGSDDPYARLTEEQIFACLGPNTSRPRRSRLHYSNYGMGLLGHLLARAAGVPFERLMEERLLAPLGMPATGVGTCGASATPVPGFRKGRPTPPWTFGALGGAGALRSTPADLLTFARACLDPPPGTLGEAFDLARRPFHRGRLPFVAQGLGWMLRLRDRRRRPAEICWHDGGTYGGSAFLAVDVRRRLAVVAVGNAGPRLIPPLDSASWALLEDLAG